MRARGGGAARAANARLDAAVRAALDAGSSQVIGLIQLLRPAILLRASPPPKRS